LITDRDEMSNLYKGTAIDASYQVSVHLAKFRFWEKNILFVSHRETKIETAQITVNQIKTCKVSLMKEEFENTKGIIRICISKNGQKKKYKRTNNDLQKKKCLFSQFRWIFNCLIIFFSIFSSCLWYLMYKSTISTCIYKQ
jgi:hypothetical protein